MADQPTFASLAWSTKGKVTRREHFLAEMNAVIPWTRLTALGLEKMLRIHFLQQWFNLSDPAAEDAIYDSESMRRFVGIELGVDTVPDESSILRFRRLIEEIEPHYPKAGNGRPLAIVLALPGCSTVFRSVRN